MIKTLNMILSAILILSILQGCKEKKKPNMVDMDTIKSDGSHDDKYIFRKELEKEESRGKKYKKNDF